MKNATIQVGLLAAFLLLGLLACPPPTGELDDDDAASDDDVASDDDAVDDDSADDDDFTIPPGTGLGGTVQYQLGDGTLPPGAVRAGLAAIDESGLPAVERWGYGVSKSGLPSGATVYTVYVEGEPPEGDFMPILEGAAEVALYFPFAYVDSDGGGGYDEDDFVLGLGETLHLFIRFEGDDTPAEIEAWGGGYGWNLVEFEDISDEDGDFDLVHTPDGTNAATGPEIRVSLLPNMGGTIPLATDVLLPTGSMVAAFHFSAMGEGAPPVPGFERFSVAASNYELRAQDLIDWEVDGAPPSSHVVPLDEEDPAGVRGAPYMVIGYYDDGDGQFTPETCDTPLAIGSPRFLLWVEPSSLDLATAFVAQVQDMPMGWTLFDMDLNTWRLLASGVELLSFDLVDGDDDSAADDDSAGDDDSSAGPDLGIPPWCLPGDDDDSAGP